MTTFEAAETVLQRARANRFRTFKYKNAARSELSGAFRIRSGKFCGVKHNPKFRIAADAKVFTMGSCFAREVESALLDRSYTLLGTSIDIPESLLALAPYRLANSELLRSKGMHVPTVTSVLNQYTPASMATEIAAAFAPDEDGVPPPGLMTFPNDLAYDFRHHGMKIGPRDQVVQARRSIDGAQREIADADVVILTLGYTESWFLTEGGIPTNGTPPVELLRRAPSLFGFVNSGYEEVSGYLEAIAETLMANFTEPPKVILTVSPVPLSDTFTDLDSITANTRSKAVLVAAAQAFVGKHDWVDYFPSYEIITHSTRDRVWEPDGVHVLTDAVRWVMDQFEAAYLE